jgi:hypothetical protein
MAVGRGIGSGFGLGTGTALGVGVGSSEGVGVGGREGEGLEDALGGGAAEPVGTAATLAGLLGGADRSFSDEGTAARGWSWERTGLAVAGRASATTVGLGRVGEPGLEPGPALR